MTLCEYHYRDKQEAESKKRDREEEEVVTAKEEEDVARVPCFAAEDDASKVRTIRAAIVASHEAKKKADMLLYNWRKTHQTCFAVVEYSTKYRDKTILSRHCSKDEAEAAKPEDTLGSTYSVEPESTQRMNVTTLKGIFNVALP